MRYELHHKDKVRKLSARETALLKILLENRHFTVDRKDILMKVWGDDSFSIPEISTSAPPTSAITFAKTPTSRSSRPKASDAAFIVDVVAIGL